MAAENRPEEEEAVIKFADGRKVGARWQVINKLDEGGFGQVYKVRDLQTEGRLGALKVESVDMEGGSAIKLEINVLNHINPLNNEQHFPALFHAKKHKKYVYMVLELLGQNLKHIKSAYRDDLISERDWARVGIQCLHAIKIMHDRGFVHRDIKPSNFVFGHASDPVKSRLIHVLDFGLARAYAFNRGGIWVPRKARIRIDFRGTYRYASPNMHRHEDLGRRDDIYSLFYMMVEFHVGLPWQHDKEKEEIDKKKSFFEENPKELACRMPAELGKVLAPLRCLTYYSRPDYLTFYDGLKAIMRREKVTLADPYEFENSERRKNFSSKKKMAPGCSCADQRELMLIDEININGPRTGGAVTEDNGMTRDDANKASARGNVMSGKTCSARSGFGSGGISGSGTNKKRKG